MNYKKNAEIIDACIADLNRISVRGRDDCIRVHLIIDALSVIRKCLTDEAVKAEEDGNGTDSNAEG